MTIQEPTWRYDPKTIQNQNSNQSKQSGFFDIRFTRFINNPLNSISWVLCILIVIAVWGYQVFTIVQGGIGGGLLIALLSSAVENVPARQLVNFLLVSLEAIICLLVARLILELSIIPFRIELRLRAIEEHSEKMSLIEEHLRAIRDKHENK